MLLVSVKSSSLFTEREGDIFHTDIFLVDIFLHACLETLSLSRVLSTGVSNRVCVTSNTQEGLPRVAGT